MAFQDQVSLVSLVILVIPVTLDKMAQRLPQAIQVLVDFQVLVVTQVILVEVDFQDQVLVDFQDQASLVSLVILDKMAPRLPQAIQD